MVFPVFSGRPQDSIKANISDPNGIDGRFLGLLIDQRTHSMFTEERIDTWLAQIKPLRLEKLTADA